MRIMSGNRNVAQAILAGVIATLVALPASADLILPFSGTYDVDDGVGFSVTYTGMGVGGAGQFIMSNPDSFSAALALQSDGIGRVLLVTHTGTNGEAANFLVVDPANPSPGISVQTYGTGAAVLGLASGDGHGMTATALGSGNGLNAAAAGSGDAVYAQADGSGRAGYFTANSLTVPVVQLEGDGDVSLNNPGILVLGSLSAKNIGIDLNEIMARNDGGTSTLFLNHQGGDVSISALGPGGLGIGTTNPLARLHIVQTDFSGPRAALIVSLSTTRPALQVIGGSGGALQVSGVVAIGNTLTAASVPNGVLLAVDGKALFEEVEVQLSEDWPDYVFDDDYPLMPLPELEASVRANKRLPGIPSAGEVQRNGIALGQMQTSLLKKVEELTLYLIDLNRELDGVRQDNESLRDRVAYLEDTSG